MSKFSNRLKDLRAKHKGLYQSSVAEAIGIDASTYSKYERGVNEPDFEILIKLADYYGVTVDYLIGKDDKTYINKNIVQEHLKTIENSLIVLKKYIDKSK